MDRWIFLRGLTRASVHWAGFVNDFEAVMPARVVALDLPGNGRLWQQQSPTSVAGMVQHCRAQLQQLGVQPPFGLLAMSLGGMVAAQWATLHANELREMVLINTSMRPFSPAWQRMQPQSFVRLLQLAVSAPDAQTWEQEILRLTTRHARHDVLAAWSHEREAHPVSGRNALRQLWAAARYRAAAERPAVPTLVLAGAQDQLVSPQCARALAAAWRSSLQLHPTAGHDLTLDAGPWVAAAVQRWHLDRRSERAA